MANSADPVSWLLQEPTDLDLHCLQRQVISEFSRTKVKTGLIFCVNCIHSEKNKKKC